MLRTILFAVIAGLALATVPAAPVAADELWIDSGTEYVAYRPYRGYYYSPAPRYYAYRYPAYTYPAPVYRNDYYYGRPYYYNRPYYYQPYGPAVGVRVGPLRWR